MKFDDMVREYGDPPYVGQTFVPVEVGYEILMHLFRLRVAVRKLADNHPYPCAREIIDEILDAKIKPVKEVVK